MKINIIPSMIVLMVSVLLAYLFYTISDAEEQMLKALAISGFVSIGICLECGIGLSFNDSHHTANSFATSIFFLIVFIVEHCCFAAWGTNHEWLIITTGLLLVLYLFVYYGISKTKM
ncbi:MAG: hypothetical protein MJZ24_03840 [Paludibacteraceae bacterium]|nr:hypothetical protein [Paludibacteraceae bacterium]